MLLASVVAAAALAVPVSSAGLSPSLQLVKRDPITVAGTNFHPLGRVKVTAYTVRTVTLAARASRTGRFQLAFAGLTFGRCGSAQVRALGTHGEVALLKIPLPACMAQ